MKLMKFKRAAVTVLIVLAAYLLQCTLFNHLELAGIKPNLILIVTASFGFMPAYIGDYSFELANNTRQNLRIRLVDLSISLNWPQFRSHLISLVE